MIILNFSNQVLGNPPNIQSRTPIALCFTVVGTAAQRAQTTTPVSSGNSGFGQQVLGAASLSLGTVMGPVAAISQPGAAQVPRQALAPNHAIQPSLLSQRLVLTSQAQARLPSKWPALLSVSPPPYGTTEYTAFERHLFGVLLICVFY